MKKFTLPADFKEETIRKYVELNMTMSNASIFETYGQITAGDLIYSGRMSDSLPTVDMKLLEKYVKTSKKYGIEFNYTFNASCMGNYENSKEGCSKIIQLVDQLWDIGITTFTVAIPEVIELIKHYKPQSNIVVSTICEVNSVQKVLFYKKLGVKRIVVDADINRNLPLITAMQKACGNILEIIINNLCLYNCAYKMFHYNHDSHCVGNEKGGSYYTTRCFIQKHKQKENLLRANWIRPEDLKRYEDKGIEYYKLQGRPNVRFGQPWKSVYAYANNFYEGNLCDVLMLFAPSPTGTYIDNRALDGFLDNFCVFRGESFSNCNDCSYCYQFAQKSVRESEFNNELLKMFADICRFEEPK